MEILFNKTGFLALFKLMLHANKAGINDKNILFAREWKMFKISDSDETANLYGNRVKTGNGNLGNNESYIFFLIIGVSCIHPV